MEQLRLFFAIKLPEYIKEEAMNLAKIGEKDIWRWTNKENLHVTVVFIGYLAEEQMPQVIDAGQKAVQNIQSFILRCKEISYGPDSNERMIWLKLEKKDVLGELKNKLEKAFLDNGINFQADYKEYNPHVTLARLKFGAEKPIGPIKKTYIKEFPVEEMTLFNSSRKENRTEYELIQNFPLN
jgi:2'-5' RNA ligase